MTAYSVIALVFGDCICADTFSCESGVDASGGIIIWVLITLYMFKALGTVCDEYFVPALEMISEALQLSNDVAGATFMAAGSSAPELFTSIVATFLIVNEGGVGAIIGSAIFNILVIVGATCVCAGQELTIWWYPLARDCLFYSIAIMELALVLMDEVVHWWEALIMFLSYVVYCVYMKFNWKVAQLVSGETRVVSAKVDCCDDDSNEKTANQDSAVMPTNGVSSVVPHSAPDAMKEIGNQHSTDSASKPSSPKSLNRQSSRLQGDQTVEKGHVARSMKELGRQATLQRLEERKSSKEGAESGKADPEEGEDEEEEVTGWRRFAVDPLNLIWSFIMPSPEHYWLLFGLSILNIAFCTYIMVDGVNRCGCNLGIGPLIMGLIFLAAGTSVPDALGSIAVAKQGEGDMAVANALGSNVFDIMLGLGVPWLIKAAMGVEVIFPGASKDLLQWILILVGVLILFVGSLIANGWKLNKVMGGVLMFFYMVHVTVALVRAFV